MAFILDTGAIQHIWETFGTDGFDLFLAADVELIIPFEVIDETLDTPVAGRQYALDFQQWLVNNSSNSNIIELPPFETEAIAYALGQDPNRNTSQLGDIVIEYLKANPHEIGPNFAFSTGAISVITDDGKLINRLSNQLGSDFSKGLMSFDFLVELRKGGHIDDAEFTVFFDALKSYLESGQSNSGISANQLDRLSNITAESTLEGLQELSLRPDVDLNNFSGADVLDIIGNKNLLAAIGVAGDLFEVGIAIHEAADAISDGDPAQAEQIMGSMFGSILGGTAGAAAGGALALAALAVVVPEPSTSVAGAAVLIGALVGAVGGSAAGDAFGNYLTSQLQNAVNNGDAITGTLLIDIMNDYAALEGIALSDAVILTNENGELEVATGSECFPAGTQISMWDGPSKPIEQIRIGDLVVSYDSKGQLVDREVTQLFRNKVRQVLNVFGRKTTPGHMTFCAEGPYSGQHVPIIEIIVSDGAVMLENGDVVRVCTNELVGSELDQFVNVLWASDYDAFLKSDFARGRMRLGTKIAMTENAVVSVSQMLREAGYEYDIETQNVVSRSGELQPMSFIGALPRPEDFILLQSGICLSDCYAEISERSGGNPSSIFASSASAAVQ